MIRIGEYTDTEGSVYLAGHLTPSGLYEEIETHQEIRLEQEGYLPARLDGRIACYVRVESLPFAITANPVEGKHHKR